MPSRDALFTVTLHNAPPSPQTMPAAWTVPPVGRGTMVMLNGGPVVGVPPPPPPPPPAATTVTVAVALAVPPLPSPTVSVAVYVPALPKMCEALAPAALPPSLNVQAYVRESPSASVPAPTSVTACPAVPAYGPPALAVGARFTGTPPMSSNTAEQVLGPSTHTQMPGAVPAHSPIQFTNR